MFSFWWAESFIDGEVDEGYWDFGVGKFAVLYYVILPVRKFAVGDASVSGRCGDA